MLKYINRIANNDYLFSIISKFTGVFLGLLFSVFYNRYLGPELKGEAAVIGNNVSLIAVFLGMGMYQAYPFFKKKEGDVFYCFINNMFTMFVICEVSAILLVFFSSIDIRMKVVYLLIPIVTFIKQINYVVLVEYPKRRNLTAIALNIIDIFIIIAFMLFSNASLIALIVILVVKDIINLILSIANLHVDMHKVRFDVSHLLKYATYGFLPMLTLLCMTVNYKIDVLMLKSFSNAVSLVDIGIYSVGVSLAEKIWLVPDAIKDILISRLAKGKSTSEVATVIRTSLFVTLISIIIMILCGRPLINLLYGNDYDGSYRITIIMLVGIIGMIFYKMVYSYNVVNGNRFINLLILGTAAIINIIGNWFFIPLYGIYGAAVVSVISYTICGFCFIIYFKRKSLIRYRDILLIKKEDIKSIISKFINRKHIA